MADAHIADLNDPALGTCYIVAAVDRDDDCIQMLKIGFTRPHKLTHRMNTLRGSSGMYQIKLVATFPGGRAKERMLHKQFAEHAIGREWFNPHPDILAICGLTTCKLGSSESNRLGGIVGKTESIAAYGSAYSGKHICHPVTNVGRGN